MDADVAGRKTQGPDGEFDWPVVKDELNGYFVDQLRSAGMFLYGRKVYEMMAYFWPAADQDPAATQPGRLLEDLEAHAQARLLQHAAGRPVEPRC